MIRFTAKTQNIEFPAEDVTSAFRETLIQVLLVDDDDMFLKSAKQCLEQQGGLSIETALSSDEAVEKMEKKNTDVIVCNIQMHVTNGFEFLKTLRDNGNTIPFVVFTITDKKELAIQALHLGANGFVGKYGDPSVVYQELKRCIESVTRTSAMRARARVNPKLGNIIPH